MIMASKSYEKHPAHKALYDALIQSLFMDEDDMDRAVAMEPSPQLKRKHDDQDEDPSARPNQGKKTKTSRTKEYESSKKSSSSKETSKGNTPPKALGIEKSMNADETITEPIEKVTMDAEENIINDDVVNDADQPQDDAVPKTDNAPKNNWFKQPPRPPTPDPEWNKCLIIDDQPEQNWFNDPVSTEKDPLTFDDLMTTPIDFSKFSKNRFKLDKITKADLVGQVYNLLMGTCQSDRCPYDLSKPLPLKERKYITSITKTKVARYELVGIEDMILKQWNVVNVGYNKDAGFRISHWGPKRQLFYRSQINKLSQHDVYSTLKILSVKSQVAKTPSEVQRMQGVPYASTIGSIIYATAVKAILKYLRNTKDMVLVYGEKPEAELKVSCYADASFKTDKDDTKSQRGYVFVLNAEYIAAAEVSMEAVWMRKFIDGLGGVMPSNKRPMEMLCDNEPAIAIANDPGILTGDRHFSRKYHYICEVIQEREIVLKKVHTDDNIADPFTKPMPYNKYYEHAMTIGIVPASNLIFGSCKDFNKKFYNSLGSVPNRCSARLGG
ncbi:hypothetical protein Tco_0237217 [Tanacetum coccineum]